MDMNKFDLYVEALEYLLFIKNRDQCRAENFTHMDFDNIVQYTRSNMDTLDNELVGVCDARDVNMDSLRYNVSATIEYLSGHTNSIDTTLSELHGTLRKIRNSENIELVYAYIKICKIILHKLNQHTSFTEILESL